jgi:hypothetical protein
VAPKAPLVKGTLSERVFYTMNSTEEELPPPYKAVLRPDQINWRDEPVETICPGCQQIVESKIDSKFTPSSVGITALVTLMSFPFYLPSVDHMKKKIHSCPNCSSRLGKKTGGLP